MKKDLREKDDAVSPVIALMLILAILATCLAVYTTTYVPGLKQQDEITHSGDVKLTFERFASDIDNLVAQGKPAVYTEVLELGGGDVPLSPTKSSGTIEIEETIIGTYTIGGVTKNLTGIEVSYLPSFTAWEPQGYLYKNGVVWITKNEKKTPASPTLYTIQNGTNRENKTIAGWYTPSGGILTIPLFSTEGVSEITGVSTVKLKLNATIRDETATEVTITLPEKTLIYPSLTIRYLNIGVSLE